MKKNLLLIPFAGIFLYLGLSSYSSGPGAMLGADLSGASGTATCSTGSGCHSTSSSSTTAPAVGIQLLDAGTPVTSYVGSHSYTIRVTGRQTTSTLTLPNFGFQVSAVNTSTTTNAGTMTASAGAHLGTYGGINIVEQSSALPATTGTGGVGTTYVVDIPWTSPVAGTGSVSFFAIINAVNASGGADAGDKWGRNSLIMPESSILMSSITGTMTTCVGTTATLSDATPGGTWSSSNPAVATIGSATGIYTGISAGIAVITYSVISAGSTTATVTITDVPSAGTITGSSLVCVGYTASLTDAAGPGAWTSSNTAMATVSSSGVVTGVAAGTVTISCSYTNSCGTASATHTMTVNPHSMCSLGFTTPNNNPIVTVLPNPNNGLFTLNLNSEKSEPVQIVITNITGAVVKELVATTSTQIEINLNQNIPGVYFISATTNSGKYNTKMIIR